MSFTSAPRDEHAEGPVRARCPAVRWLDRLAPHTRRTAVAYPDDLLSPSEHVVIHNHPHWKMLLLPVFVLLAVVAAFAFTASLVSEQSWGSIAQIALAVVGVVL